MNAGEATKGFTIIELMIVLVVAALLLTVGIPAFTSTVMNNQLTTQVNALVADINLARSEAVKRNVRVIMCRSANPGAATPSCGGTAQTWTTGWLIFADDGNNTNNVYDSGTDILIRTGQPALAGVAIMTNATSNNNLEYNPDGSTNEGGGTALFSVCDDRGTNYGKQVQVSPTGRPKFVPSPIADCSP
jgi:type IV fimbrial biogenesis protein FimT